MRTGRPTFGPALALLSLTIAACGGEGGGSAHAGAPWTLTGPEVRIGSVDDSAFAFGQVMKLALGPDGVLYSIHQQEATIRKWTPDGHPAGTLGHKGKGPGEFTQPINLGFVADTLWVLEGMGLRLTKLATDGTLLATVNPNLTPRQSDPDQAVPRPSQPLRDGRWYGTLVRRSSTPAEGGPEPHILMKADGTILDTVWVEQTRPTDAMSGGNKNMRLSMRQPFSDAPKDVALDYGSVIVADFRVPDRAEGATYTVTKVADTGDTLWHTVVPYAPTPLPRERPESVFEAMTGNFPPGFADLAKELRGQIYAPPFVPEVLGLLVSDDGSVWIHEADEDVEASHWQVLDARGEPEGRAVVPAGLNVLLIHGDEIWGVEKDDLDVNYIVRYRVDRHAT